MRRYLFAKFFSIIPVALGVVTIVSLIIYLIPGDPVEILAGPYALEEDKFLLRKQLGLDQNIFLQVLGFFQKLLHLDLGQSLLLRKDVTSLILERLPATMELAVLGVILATLISVPMGIISALRHQKLFDHLVMSLSVIGICIPTFWLGPLLVMVFSIELHLLPVSERSGLLSYILPSLTLGFSLAAVTGRMTRASVLEILGEDYIRTARAKGLSEKIVILKHVLRNALIPVVTIIGLQFGVLLTGAIITEKVFDWPGLGSLLVEAITNRDYPVVQGCVLLFSGIYLLVNAGVDVINAWIDPRIKFD